MVCQVVKLRSETNAWRLRLASMFIEGRRSMVALMFAGANAGVCPQVKKSDQHESIAARDEPGRVPACGQGLEMSACSRKKQRTCQPSAIAPILDRMRRIDPSRSILVFWADLTYHEAALLADDEAKHLAPPVSKALDDFTVILNLDLDTRRAVLKTTAKSGVVDIHIDGRIRKLHSAALFLVNQVRKQPEFKSLFSETINKVVRYALKRQVEVAEKLIETLGMKMYSDEFRMAHLPDLQTLVAAGKTVLGEVRAAEMSRTEARLDIRAWKDDANALRLANYGELVANGAKTGRTRDWADAFFLNTKSAAAVGDDDSTEASPEHAAEAG